MHPFDDGIRLIGVRYVTRLTDVHSEACRC